MNIWCHTFAACYVQIANWVCYKHTCRCFDTMYIRYIRYDTMNCIFDLRSCISCTLMPIHDVVHTMQCHAKQCNTPSWICPTVRQPDFLSDCLQPDFVSNCQQPDFVSNCLQPDFVSDCPQPDFVSDCPQLDFVSDCLPTWLHVWLSATWLRVRLSAICLRVRLSATWHCVQLSATWLRVQLSATWLCVWLCPQPEIVMTSQKKPLHDCSMMVTWTK